MNFFDLWALREPGRGKNCSHCSFEDFHSLSKETQVSLVRTFLSEAGPESKISRLGGWVWKNDPELQPSRVSDPFSPRCREGISFPNLNRVEKS